jgi:ADP-ribose pyrophosphatase
MCGLLLSFGAKVGPCARNFIILMVPLSRTVLLVRRSPLLPDPAASGLYAGSRPICAGTSTPWPDLSRRTRHTVRLKVSPHAIGYATMTMAEDWPKIKARRTTRVSPWMAIIEREVEFAPGAPAQLYHAIGQQDYIAIVAALPDGRIPVVRQYRPALEGFTWELPAGLVDPGEDAAACCRRELMEETGFAAEAVHALGVYAPCTARLSNRVHSFFVAIGPIAESKPTEPGIELKLVSLPQLTELILAGEFVLQLHIGALLLAGLRGYIDLGAFQIFRTGA